jgi:hypothetical protein
MYVKPFRLELKDGTIIDNAGALQEFVMKLSDQLPPMCDPKFATEKERYNKFAKFYNENVCDVWTIYK